MNEFNFCAHSSMDVAQHVVGCKNIHLPHVSHRSWYQPSVAQVISESFILMSAWWLRMALLHLSWPVYVTAHCKIFFSIHYVALPFSKYLFGQLLSILCRKYFRLGLNYIRHCHCRRPLQFFLFGMWKSFSSCLFHWEPFSGIYCSRLPFPRVLKFNHQDSLEYSIGTGGDGGNFQWMQGTYTSCIESTLKAHYFVQRTLETVV